MSFVSRANFFLEFYFLKKNSLKHFRLISQLHELQEAQLMSFCLAEENRLPLNKSNRKQKSHNLRFSIFKSQRILINFFLYFDYKTNMYITIIENLVD